MNCTECLTIHNRGIPFLDGILLCKSWELSQRGYSMSHLSSILHGIPVILHTPGAYSQCSMFDHSGDKQPWKAQFQVGWSQPLQLWLSAGISLVALVMVSRGIYLGHAQLHPTWFAPTAGCTVYPKKYAHGFVVLCFVVVMQSFIMNSHKVFIHIHQGCFAGTGAIVRLSQCQLSKPDGYGKISQCITTTKQKPCAYFLGYIVVDQWLQICIVATCRWVYILV